jgi:hypothetical protein
MPIYRWFTYQKWGFSMAMLNNQMVNIRSQILDVEDAGCLVLV